MTNDATVLRRSAGVWAREGWGVLRARGKDRLGFLHKYLTQDVKGLAPGQGAQACALTVKGAMVSDLLLLAREEEALLLLAPAGREPLLQHLSKYVLFDDVKFEDATAELAVLALAGPEAPRVAAAALGGDPPAAPLAHLTGSIAGAGAVVVRDDLGRVPAFDLLVARDAAPAVRDALMAAGATAVEPAAAEVVRVEEGVPLFGVDLDERTIPVEAGYERAISYTKGCYTGQEVIARIAHRGHVNRRMAGIRFPAGTPPAIGPLFAGEKEVARVTSAALSPSAGPIGLALLHKKHADGSELAFGAPGGPQVKVGPVPLA